MSFQVGYLHPAVVANMELVFLLPSPGTVLQLVPALVSVIVVEVSPLSAAALRPVPCFSGGLFFISLGEASPRGLLQTVTCPSKAHMLLNSEQTPVVLGTLVPLWVDS